MTIFDLLFLVCAVTTIGTIVRVVYLVVRGRARRAGIVVVRLGIGAVVYLVTLLVMSLVRPGTTIPAGAPHCFDDFCITIDSASRMPALGALSGNDDFIIVSGQLSTTARRRQREVDIRGGLLDERDRRYEVSARGEHALQQLGQAGTALTDFVEPTERRPFKLAFEVPKTARTLRYVTRHGWFPGAIIIAGGESLLHRPSTVQLSTR